MPKILSNTYFAFLFLIISIFIIFQYEKYQNYENEKQNIKEKTYERVCSDLKIFKSDCDNFSLYLYEVFENKTDVNKSIFNLRQQFVNYGYEAFTCDLFVIFSITRIYGGTNI